MLDLANRSSVQTASSSTLPSKRSASELDDDEQDQKKTKSDEVPEPILTVEVQTSTPNNEEPDEVSDEERMEQGGDGNSEQPSSNPENTNKEYG